MNYETTCQLKKESSNGDQVYFCPRIDPLIFGNNKQSNEERKSTLKKQLRRLRSIEFGLVLNKLEENDVQCFTGEIITDDADGPKENEDSALNSSENSKSPSIEAILADILLYEGSNFQWELRYRETGSQSSEERPFLVFVSVPSSGKFILKEYVVNEVAMEPAELVSMLTSYTRLELELLKNKLSITVENESKKLHQVIEELTIEKETSIDRMFRAFTVCLNEKKKRIKYLEKNRNFTKPTTARKLDSSCSSSETEEEDEYMRDTDIESDEDSEKKRKREMIKAQEIAYSSEARYKKNTSDPSKKPKLVHLISSSESEDEGHLIVDENPGQNIETSENEQHIAGDIERNEDCDGMNIDKLIEEF